MGSSCMLSFYCNVASVTRGFGLRRSLYLRLAGLRLRTEIALLF